ncbi:MAG: hypothetical protein ACI8TX_001808 [Hyphomicrobiaceae bacterium]|jgi:hypothetical protein
MMKRFLLVVCLAVAFLAMGATLDVASTQAAPTQAGPRIVQGTQTTAFPAVGMLMAGSEQDRRSMVCTGTMVGCRTFLTAAHCVCLGSNTGADCQPPTAPDASRYHVFLQHAGVFDVERIAVHPNFDFPDADLAVITLANDVLGVAPVALTSTPAVAPRHAQVVGFGRPTGVAPLILGIKREGAVRTTTCNSDDNDEMICWDFVGEGANTCSGDSGGPLFFGDGSDRVLAGVTGGGDAANCLAPDHSHDVNLFKYRDWISSQAPKIDGITHCGAGPQAGDEAGPIVGFAGELSEAAMAETHSFEVLEGTRELRVGFNGREGQATDFSYFVRQGVPAQDGIADCTHILPLQSGLCVFTNPTPGTWFVTVESFRGSGEYQFSALAIQRMIACGDPDGSGTATASDALFALRAAVGAGVCAPSVCDADGSGRVTAGDALTILRIAVEQVASLACPTVEPA